MRDRAAPDAFVVERLKRRSDFRAAANGARVSGRAFALQARVRGDDGAVRVGFTVSKQVGDAVERNRVRRRLREIVRLSARAASGSLRAGHDYVLVGRRAALAAPFADMIRDLEAALARIEARAGIVTGREGTGDISRDPLHEAGSPARPLARRGTRKEPRTPVARPNVKPPELPPRER